MRAKGSLEADLEELEIVAILHGHGDDMLRELDRSTVVPELEEMEILCQVWKDEMAGA